MGRLPSNPQREWEAKGTREPPLCQRTLAVSWFESSIVSEHSDRDMPVASCSIELVPGVSQVRTSRPGRLQDRISVRGAQPSLSGSFSSPSWSHHLGHSTALVDSRYTANEANQC